MTGPSEPSPFRLGTRRGLEACASARGTFAVLALDHRQNLRRELHPEAPETTTYEEMVAFKRAVIRALAPHATGSLLDPEIGAAQCSDVAAGSDPGPGGATVAAPGIASAAAPRTAAEPAPARDTASTRRPVRRLVCVSLNAAVDKTITLERLDASERPSPIPTA